MPELSLTTLVDITSKSGISKARCIERAKKQASMSYEPAKDFYKGVREALITAHSTNSHLNGHFASFLKNGIHDPKKYTHYSTIIKCYQKWHGRKDSTWFDPPKGHWDGGHGFAIRVNPELGLSINSTEHIIKLYFKSDDEAHRMTKNKAQIILFLMQETLSNSHPNALMSLLDIRNSKLYSGPVNMPLAPVLLRS